MGLVRRDLECPWAGSWLAFSCGNRGAWIMCLFWSRRVPIKAAEFLQSETPGAQAWDWDVFSSAFCVNPLLITQPLLLVTNGEHLSSNIAKFFQLWATL